MHRRTFLSWLALAPPALLSSAVDPAGSGRTAPDRLFFASGGKTCLIAADGSGLEVLTFDAPDQATWQPCGFFPDGRVLLLSMEPRRDGPGRPFDQYYHQTPTHLWTYDLKRKALIEIATRDRLAPFTTPALLLGDDRLLVQVVRRGDGQIYSIRLDGSDARAFTQPGEGMPYGLSASPDGKRVAFHMATPQGYQVFTADASGTNRKRVAGAPGHLYFGTQWSPDGQWILYADCLHESDPGHDWADVCIGRPDGSEHRVLTSGQAMWFGASYGGPKTPGGGSNVPVWAHDGAILFPRRLPGSRVAWEFQAQRPDTDHFNRDYKPQESRGGTRICRLNLRDGSMRDLTESAPPLWDFRCSESPRSHSIAFCRCAVGESPALWVMDGDGKRPRMLTRGPDGSGADHPRWLPRG